MGGAGQNEFYTSVILGISAAKVKKQLEHIYAKLGVEGRSAASLRALEKLSAGNEWMLFSVFPCALTPPGSGVAGIPLADLVVASFTQSIRSAPGPNAPTHGCKAWVN